MERYIPNLLKSPLLTAREIQRRLISAGQRGKKYPGSSTEGYSIGTPFGPDKERARNERNELELYQRAT